MRRSGHISRLASRLATPLASRLATPLALRVATPDPSYMPALDGLRALAITLVLVYHLGHDAMAGGYLGVDLFFVLSGFLITSLLLHEHRSSGRISLRAFWSRRARRLLPALLALLAAVGGVLLWTSYLRGTPVSAGTRSFRSDILATLAYGANWHQWLADQSYFTRFGAPSPLQHTWSLAIEEQFYLVWPLVLTLLLWRTRRRRIVRAGAAMCSAAALASAVLMTALYAYGSSVDRIYYGTDTRAFDLLIGAAIAFGLSGSSPRFDGRRASKRALGLSAPLALAVLLALAATAGKATGPPAYMFEGGFLVAALAAGVLVASSACGANITLTRLLSLRPIRYVGKISYGLYLWHWPVTVEMNRGTTGLSAATLTSTRLLVTFALAIASYHFVEQPLRHLRFAHTGKRLRIFVPSAGIIALFVTMGAAILPAPAIADAPSVLLGHADAAPGIGGLSDEHPILLPGAPGGSRPLRVLLIGDSVMRDEAPALGAALDSTGAAVVIDHSFPGWGLSTDGGWREEVPALVESDKPDLVIAMWSWDDEWLLRDPAAYRAALESFVEALLATGGTASGRSGAAGVIFEQFPPVGSDPGFDSASPTGSQGSFDALRSRGVNAWNSLVASMPRRFPGKVMYFPLSASVAPKGRFLTWLPGVAPPSSWVRVRATDGTHLCPSGAARYANATLGDLSALYHLPPPARGWSTGAWSRSPAYSQLSGLCPDDHPTVRWARNAG